MKAIFNGEVIAESEDTIYLEGNHYFPPESIDERHLKPATMRSASPWKGLASYYTIEPGGQSSKHAAWTYRQPFPGFAGSATTSRSGPGSRSGREASHTDTNPFSPLRRGSYSKDPPAGG